MDCGQRHPHSHIRRRIGRLADGWFVLCSPEEFRQVRDDIVSEAIASGRDPSSIGTEAGIAVVGPREREWQSRLAGWRAMDTTHICLRTLGGNLTAKEHITKIIEAYKQLSIA